MGGTRRRCERYSDSREAWARAGKRQQRRVVIMEERDFWRVAQHMIRLHGSQAQFDAAVRAERARLSGDPAGHDIWRVVMHKVRELQREPLPGELQ